MPSLILHPERSPLPGPNYPLIVDQCADMADNTPPLGSAHIQSDESSSPRQNGQQHPLSCTHCRQRKVKCNKIHPCSPCQRSGLECFFPERVRHPKKKKNGSKTTNEELLARLARMEQLIGKMEGDGKGIKEESPQVYSPPAAHLERRRRANTSDGGASGLDGPASPSDGLNRYIGGNFWRSLTSEVSGWQGVEKMF